MAQTKPNANQWAMIKRRGLDPKNYLVLRESYTTLWLKDVRYNKIKILYKYN